MTADNELRLEVAAGRAQGFSLVVDERLVIGRNSDGPGRLAGDPELSRHHAEIARAPNGEFTINDLSSTNGTFVNGTRLNTPAVLTVGDEIAVGTSKLVVISAPVPAAQVRADVDARAVTAVPGALETIREPAETAPVQTEPVRTEPVRTEPVRTEPEPPVRRPLLTVRVTADFERETARLSVDGTGEPMQLVLEHGRWRADDRGS